MKKLSLLFLTLTVLVLSSSEITAIKLDDCNFGFKTKRLFNPIRKMSSREKNKELKEYAQSSVSNHWLFGTFRYFKPLKDYASNILYLVQHDADPNMSIPYKYSRQFKAAATQNATFKPIYLFIDNNDAEGTHLLLEHGADANEPIIGEFHPLLLAKKKEVAELLLQYGAKTKYTSYEIESYDWRSQKSTKLRKDIFDAICSYQYDPELIPLYLAQLEEENRKEKAQMMLDQLDYYHRGDPFEDGTVISKSYSDILEKKKSYLIQAGAQLKSEKEDAKK